MASIIIINNHLIILYMYRFMTSFVTRFERFDVPMEQVDLLLQLRFPLRQISQLLSVSESTIRRRMATRGVSVRRMYSTLSETRVLWYIRWFGELDF